MREYCTLLHMGSETGIPCSKAARNAVRDQKRGGESYSDVLIKMVGQYDPELAHVEEMARRDELVDEYLSETDDDNTDDK